MTYEYVPQGVCSRLIRVEIEDGKLQAVGFEGGCHGNLQGICSRLIRVEIEDGKLQAVGFEGGCHGNLQGICSLVKDMDVDEVLRRLEGINCRGKGTSCPDQLCRAIRAAQAAT